MKCITIFLLLSLLYVQCSARKQSYVVYMGAHSHGTEFTSEDLLRVTYQHHNFLASFVGSHAEAKDAIFHSYTHHINGFAANLDEDQAAQISKHPDVVSVFLDKGKKLHTTHSWDFMMLENNNVIDHKSAWHKARLGEDVIIANLDSGVWPESKSFSDEGFGPVPSRWKGLCENVTGAYGVPCNRKLIGARHFDQGYKASGGKENKFPSARDSGGHGTHTLSTAGGNFVPGANILGVANGTASGGSPKARVAAYKVCWTPVNNSECFDSDILAAFDVAIHDGVDVLSLSLGGDPANYFEDGLAIGAFHAVRHGIPVICSAGNSGPSAGTVTNVAPWILTVGASTIDRKFQKFAELGNGQILEGESLTPALPESKQYPLVSAAKANLANVSSQDALLCKADTLDSNKVKGQVLVCLRGETDRVDKGLRAKMAGAAGMILCNAESNGNDIAADLYLLPAIQLNYTDCSSLFSYINSTDNPTAFIAASAAKYGIKPAPVMASFSSRGPNVVTPEILKPDVTAPGVNIMAAYSEVASPTEKTYDKRRASFMIMSGTSMACPHVAGVAGLIRSDHPKWSPAAIRSAIMTTARSRDNTFNPMQDGTSNVEATPFSHGTGHIRPNRALNPGLVYDLTTTDYVNFMCALGYNQTMIKTLYNGSHKCPKDSNPESALLNFNNPSITVPKLSGPVTLTRTVKNVGSPGTYASRVRQLPGVFVNVEPTTLMFNKSGEEKRFKVTFTPKHTSAKADEYKFGDLTWSDGKHYVRSPIVVASAA